MTSPLSFESETNGLRLSAVSPQLFWDICASLKMASREKDLGDIDGLIAVHGRELDWNYCLATARQLDEALATDLAETLRRIRTAKTK